MWRTINMLVESEEGTILYDDALFNIFCTYNIFNIFCTAAVIRAARLSWARRSAVGRVGSIALLCSFQPACVRASALALLFSSTAGDDTPLKALVRNDLLRVEPALSRGGDRLKAGSPVFLEAFRRLVHHQDKLKWGMDLLTIKFQIGEEQKKINAVEEELMRIAQTADEVLGTRQLQARAQQFGGRTHSSWGDSGRVEKGSYAYGAGQQHGEAEAAKLFTRQAFLVTLLHDSHVKIAAYDVKRRECEKQIKTITKVA